jgi:hypothetical protein
VPSHSTCCASALNAFISITGRVACANLLKEIGAPISEVMTFAISLRRALYASASLPTAAIRSAGSSHGQGPSSKALRAASTARSMSAGEAAATVAMTSSVCGETTSNLWSVAGACQVPPMNSCPSRVMTRTLLSRMG